ncbi:MAG: hypothetical protein J5730_03200 [Bacteroidales bacterium]|nr:hypothetical protein [Bacteroidales bacterium]
MDSINNPITKESTPHIQESQHTFSEHEKNLMDEACTYLYGISQWSKFFFVLSIMGITFLAIAGIMFLVAFPAIESISNTPPMPKTFIGVLYLILALVYIIPTIYLKRLYTAADNAMNGNDNEAMVAFLKSHRSLWKFYGIFYIVMFAFCILVVPIVSVLSAL